MDRRRYDKIMRAVVFTLGCKVNGCESAYLAGGLSSLGYEVTDKLSYADLYIINTCAVTAEAEKKSRQAIARARKYNPAAKIIITGCASQKSPDDFLKKEGVTLVTGASAKEKILDKLFEEGKFIEKEGVYAEWDTPLINDRTRAYIKVEDGCDNFCSYCVIPYLRGRVRSRDPEKAREEIEHIAPLEAVITGINLSSYSYEGKGVIKLIEGLKGVNCRIRLGSLEPRVITEDFLRELKNLKDFAPHFHLSLQSGSDKVLKSMNRKYTREEFAEKCDLIRKFFPDAGITTDIIVGYSTEREEDFNDSLELARRVRFSDIHCFPYSKREGTAGAKLKELPASVKNERMDKMLALKAELKGEFINNNSGKTFEVVPEEQEGDYTVGYTGNYIRCYIKAPFERKIYKVKALSAFADGVLAKEI